VQMESRKLEVLLDAFAMRLNTVTTLAVKAKASVARLEQSELRKLRQDTSQAIKARTSSAKWSEDELFAAVDADKDGAISKADLTAFLKECQGFEFAEENFAKVFGSFDLEDGKESIKKEQFLRFVRVYYRVIKETVLTTERAIKGSKLIRRLAVDELISLLEGPLRDDALDVARIRGTAVKDGSVGWVTVTGNGGAVFAEEGQALHEVVRATDLSSCLSVASAGIVRALSVGEVLDILEFDQKDEDAKVVRMKVKAKEDGASGWVTKASAEGLPYLKLALS